jgi:hypothetical protein
VDLVHPAQRGLIRAKMGCDARAIHPHCFALISTAEPCVQPFVHTGRRPTFAGEKPMSRGQ